MSQSADPADCFWPLQPTSSIRERRVHKQLPQCMHIPTFSAIVLLPLSLPQQTNEVLLVSYLSAITKGTATASLVSLIKTRPIHNKVLHTSSPSDLCLSVRVETECHIR